MKKSKVFMAAGAFVLAITAIFATKANKRFTSGPFQTGYLKGNTSDYIVFPSAVLTIKSNLGQYPAAFMTITTNGTNTKALVSYQLYTSQGNKPLFLEP